MKRPRQSRPPRLDPATAVVAIVGSGLAGLSTAKSLEQAGFRNICMYERDASLDHRKEGYGLTLTYHPSGILSKLGILDQVADADSPSRSHYLFDSDGSVKGYFGNSFSTGSASGGGWGQRGNLRVPRQVVRRILLESLKYTKLCWGYKLNGVQVVNEATLQEQVRLEFATTANSNGTLFETADVLVAADGIRSAVVRNWIPKAPAPVSTGIRLILGLTNKFTHALVHERGFYTLAKGVRLFVMPYAGASLLLPDTDEPVRYMWQLSFWAGDGDADTDDTTAAGYQQQALDICREWHEPVQSMIRETPVETVWSTVLCDRDPTALYQELLRQPCQRVIITGDALHAMTVFKGQGANQALQDGAVVAKWLVRASLYSAAKSCMREMVQRTALVVKASREAAMYWHSPQALVDPQKFAGVQETCVSELLVAMKESGITADSVNLDERIALLIEKLGVSAMLDNNGKVSKTVKVDESKFPAALLAAESGALGDLRKLSYTQSGLIRSVRQADTGRGCLHVAAKAGHLQMVYWLVTEAGCSVNAKDDKGQTAADLADGPKVKDLLQELRSSQ